MSYATTGGTREVHAGPLTKMGGSVKNWKKRWMILQSNRTLQYFKEPRKDALGTINLNDINFDVSPGTRNSCNWPKNCDIDCSLILTTTHRVYYMFADTVREAEEWMSLLQKYADEASNARGTNSTLPSRYNKMGGKAGDLSTPTAVPDGHMPKMYKKKDRRLPTKRFNTVSGKELEDDEDEDDPRPDKGGVVGGSMSGTDDMRQFDQLETSLVGGNEGIYDLANSTDEKPRVTSPNSNNNNGQGSTVSLHDSLHDSLYDLVGRINAGEEDTMHNNASGSREMLQHDQEVYEEICEDVKDNLQEVEQETYEIMSEPTTPSHSAATSSPARAKPENVALEKKSSLGFLPKQQSADIYEPIEGDEDPHQQQQALYEEIESSKSGLIDSADSSDEETSQPLVSHQSLPTILPPPIPKPRSRTKTEADESTNDVTYDNAPALPLKVPSRSPSPLPLHPSGPMSSELDDDDSFYGNAALLPQKPTTTPPQDIQKNMKSPIPTPRKASKGTPPKHTPPTDPPTGASESEDIYDDTVGVVISSARLSNSGDVSETREEHLAEEEEVDESAPSKPQTLQSQDKAESPTPADTSEVSTVSDESTPITYRTSPKKSNSRVHSATLGSTRDQGIAMFHKRARDVCSTVETEKPRTEAIKQLLLSSEEPVNAASVAETLREIEMERLRASEERFKWERERLKLEEDRRRFEEEKKKFEEEKRLMEKQKK